MSSKSQLTSILIVEDSHGRREIVLDRDVYSLGRDHGCDIRLASQFVSRHHATLVQKEAENDAPSYKIVDGDLEGKPSSNGMLINGRKLQSHQLNNEDEIVFGPQARAIYYQLRIDRDRDTSGVQTDPDFDITLISPNMITEESEDI